MVNVAKRATIRVASAALAAALLAGFGGSGAARLSGTIAFAARTEDTAATDLYLIRADGTRFRQLTRDAREEAGPTWAPDGKSIAFTATTFRPDGTAISEISVMTRNGSKRRLLFRTPSRGADVTDLAWSPDGRRLAFTWVRGNAWHLWLLHLDGSIDPLTSELGQHASWAPDGKRLVYDGPGGIFVRNVETGKTRYVSGTADAAYPLWSPNGRWLVVASLNRAINQFDALDVMTPTGAKRQQLVKGGVVSPVAWAPTSNAILFGRSQGSKGLGARQLFILSLRDRRVTPVPGTVGVAGSASWHR